MLFQAFFGTVDNPLDSFPNSYGGLESANGPVTFLSNIFQLVALGAGLFGLVNLILAGLRYVSSSGDPQKVEAAQKQMFMSLIGLIIVVLAYTIAAILGQVLFGNASFLFNPEIFGPGN